jgi:sec-independent protein translocase protein TatA
MEGLFRPTHIIFILLIVLIIFGPGKLPELGRGLGKGIREFKDAIKGGLSSDGSASGEKKAEPAAKAEAVEPTKVEQTKV